MPLSAEDMADVLADHGEDVTWVHGGAETQLSAVVHRLQSGETEQDDGRQVRAVGSLTCRRSDLPAGAGQYDLVRATRPASGATETWAVGALIRESGGGALVAFEISIGGQRRMLGREIER